MPLWYTLVKSIYKYGNVLSRWWFVPSKEGIHESFPTSVHTPLFRARLVDYNGNYIEIRICIIRNKKWCNIVLITIHLFGDNTIIESRRQCNESILNHT